MHPSISLILPVFNGERTLLRSLDSVQSQTFMDFECIVVNDGSTDGTAALLAAYASADSRFRAITIPNGGVSHAKNTGLAEAKGDFLGFLDCDDALEPHALETLHRLITETEADIAIAHISFEDAEGRSLALSPPLPSLAENPWLLSPAQAVDIVFHGQPFAGHLHAKLLRASAMDGLRYREDIFIYEDMLFLLEALSQSKLVAYTPVIAHHYTVTAEGALSASLSRRKASSLLACYEMRRLIASRFPSATQAANHFSFANALWVLEELAASPAPVRHEAWAKAARQRALGEIRGQPAPPTLPWVQKLFCYALRLGFPVFCSLYRGPYRVMKAFVK